MPISEIRAATRLSQAAFGKLCGGIPIRTIQNWEAGTNAPPAYVISLIIFKLTANGYDLFVEKDTLRNK